MHVSTNRWRLKALAFALGLAAALAMALTPATALAEASDSGQDTSEDNPYVICVDADGNESRHKCEILDEDTETPIYGGWWLLKEGVVPKDEVIKVLADTHIVCSGAVDLGSGCLHAQDSIIDLYVDRDRQADTSLSSTNYLGAIESDMAVGSCPFPASITDAGHVSYLNEAGEWTRKPKEECAGNLCDIRSDDVTLTSGFYYLPNSWTFGGCMEIKGDVTIVVGDGTKLTVKYGIHVPPSSSLTVFGQGAGDGEVNVHAGLQKRHGSALTAVIGGGCNESNGNIALYGVHVRAEGDVTEGADARAAGIGGGYGANGGNITICRSEVYAMGGNLAAGIGGGGSDDSDSNPGKGGKVLIEDSKVTAIGDGGAAGIGAGRYIDFWACTKGADGGDVTILGDSVVDAKSLAGAAIGRSRGGKEPGKVTFSDNLRVVDLDNGEEIAPFDLRGEYCKYRNHVRVEPGESK